MILQSMVVGDTLDFVDQVPDYPASDGWTLKYVLVPQFATPTQAAITLTATTYLTTDYRIQAAPGLTTTWTKGIYTWARWVEKTGARYSLGEGRIELLTDPTVLAQGFDLRTVAQKAFEDAQAALASFQATSGRVKVYSIAGRSMEFDTSAELVALAKYWENEVSKELAAKAVAAGKPSTRRYFTRLTNA